MEESRELPAHHVLLSKALNRLGQLSLSRSLDPERALVLAAQLEAMGDELDRQPAGWLKETVHSRNRIAKFVESGEWPEPPPSGSQLEFDPVSVVGGEMNPFSIGARYFRDGSEAVGRVTLGPCFEGPPGRAHGGVICAVFDEVLGSVFRATGAPSAFTGELSVRFEAAAPLGAPLEFRGRLVESKGRRQFLEGEASGPDGRFASAKAIFINMTPEHLGSD